MKKGWTPRNVVVLAVAAISLGLSACAMHHNNSSMSNDMTDNNNPMVGGAPMSPQETIVQNASKANNLTTLVKAVKAAGLVDTLSSKGLFTVFAPTNAAFNKLPQGTVQSLLKPANKPMLRKILTYHVVAGDITAQDAMKMVMNNGGQYKVKTVEGDTLTLMTRGKHLMIKDGRGDVATVTKANVKQSNGVVHVIDTVLLPPK